MHMMSKKEQSSEELDTLRRSRTRTVVLTANSEVHTHEAAQVFGSRLKPVRDGAVARGNACSLIAWKILRGPRILLWVGQWSKTTVDQRRENNYMPSAHSSQDSDSERHTKEECKSRKYSIYTHFPKDRTCDVCIRTKKTRAPCRKRTGEALLQAAKLGDVITADNKVLNEGCESRDNHLYAVVEPDLATQSIQSHPCETKLHMRRKRVCYSSWNRRTNHKSFTLTTHWGLENHVKIYHDSIELQHLNDPRQMATLTEPFDEWKKALQQYCDNLAWVKMVG